MQDNFNINDWRIKMINESLEEAEVPKETPKDNNFSQASDKLYKKVTGEEPKVATKNKFRDVKEGEDQTYIVAWWEFYNDDWDNDFTEVQASSEEEAIQKAKSQAPRGSKDFKAKLKTIKENKMKKSDAVKMIKETILASLSEKKKKKDETEDVTDIVDTETETSDAPEGGSDLAGGAKEVQDALSSLQAAAKSLGDDKLNGQVSNLITYFTRTHVSKGQ